MYVIFWDWLFRGLRFLKTRINVLGEVLKPKDQDVDFFFSLHCVPESYCIRILFQPMFGFDFFGSFKIHIDL